MHCVCASATVYPFALVTGGDNIMAACSNSKGLELAKAVDAESTVKVDQDNLSLVAQVVGGEVVAWEKQIVSVGNNK